MIKIFKKFSTDERLMQISKFQEGVWIDIIAPTESEMKKITKALKHLQIPDDFFFSGLDEDERPRFEIERNNKLIIINVPTKTKNSEIRIIPLSIIVTEENVITVHLKELELFEDFYEDKVKDFYTTKKNRFVMQILFKTYSIYQKFLDEIEKEINAVEQRLLKSPRNKEILSLLKTKKVLTYFSKAVWGNEILLENILSGRVLTLFEEDKDVLEDVIIENKQCIEIVSIYDNIIKDMLDAYSSILSNNLNTIMKILASITIIISIPTIISSIYGMNVQLPIAESPLAFWIILGFSFLVTMFVTYLFMKKDWL